MTIQQIVAATICVGYGVLLMAQSNFGKWATHENVHWYLFFGTVLIVIGAGILLYKQQRQPNNVNSKEAPKGDG